MLFNPDKPGVSFAKIIAVLVIMLVVIIIALIFL